MSEPQPNILYRPASPGEIQPLRGKILRPGAGILLFPEDYAPPPLAWHFGAFTGAPPSACIACLTFLASRYENAPALQLRGMAVDEDFRRRRVGSTLLQFAEGTVSAAGTRLLWCNARLAAIPFYAHLGWHSVSPTFLIPDAGPHQIMVKHFPLP